MRKCRKLGAPTSILPSRRSFAAGENPSHVVKITDGDTMTVD
jgi:hypothetical protein